MILAKKLFSLYVNYFQIHFCSVEQFGKIWIHYLDARTLSYGTRFESLIWLQSLTVLEVIIKFIYSEKVTKFCKIFTLFLSFVVAVKIKVKISQKFCGLLRIYEL